MNNRKPEVGWGRISSARASETSEQRDHYQERDRSAHASWRNADIASNTVFLYYRLGKYS